jgi:hypothetical protein
MTMGARKTRVKSQSRSKVRDTYQFHHEVHHMSRKNVQAAVDAFTLDGAAPVALGSVRANRDTIESYFTVIATRTHDDVIVFNATKYSVTTSHLQNALRARLDAHVKQSGRPYAVVTDMHRGITARELIAFAPEQIEVARDVIREKDNERRRAAQAKRDETWPLYRGY